MRKVQRAHSATMDKGLPDGQSLPDNRGRKVRSPQGSVPANGRGGVWRRRSTESATENIPPGQPGKGEMVR